MGQRSQIYIRFYDKNGKYKLIARYFPWNFGERMVSRVRWTCEWAAEFVNDLYCNMELRQRLISIVNTNFDMHDVAVSTDLVAERNEQFPEEDLNGYVFGPDNCNDGKAFIDLTGDQIKYAFTDWDAKTVMDVEAYMAWDYSTPDWKNKILDLTEDDREAFASNSEWLQENAVLMTHEELLAFKSYPYDPEPVIPEAVTPHKLIEKLTGAVSTSDYPQELKKSIFSLLEQAQNKIWEGMTEKVDKAELIAQNAATAQYNLVVAFIQPDDDMNEVIVDTEFISKFSDKALAEKCRTSCYADLVELYTPKCNEEDGEYVRVYVEMVDEAGHRLMLF